MRHVVVLFAVLGVCGCGGGGGASDATDGEVLSEYWCMRLCEESVLCPDWSADGSCSCIPCVCGNGVFEIGELCDDGNAVSGDGCSPGCTTEICGDGYSDPGEQCDDGNLVGGDGCSATCAVEACGNGTIDVGEECDDGSGNSDTVPDACRTDCRRARCGDGVVDRGEECDDGNTTADDGCSPTCETDCGNGVVDPGEECDDGPGNSDEPDAACRTDCRTARCGDGVTDTDRGEECDLLNLGGQTCMTLGHDAGGSLRCDAACRYDETFCRSPECGNDVCELGETTTGCPGDCHDGCGDGSCAEAEDQFTCPADCGAVGISRGGVHACAVLADGTVRCWGSNEGGELGDGTAASSAAPVTVLGLTDVVDVRVGTEPGSWTEGMYKGYSCAVLADGSVSCWGHNTDGQLGNGTYASSGVPASVSGLTGVVALSTGGSEGLSRVHTCSLLPDGTGRCWGANNSGELGDGTTTDSAVPVPVAGLASAVAISADGDSSCAVYANGTGACWGDGGDSRVNTLPVPVFCLERAIAVAGSMFLLSDGTLRRADSEDPFPGLTDAVALSEGQQHDCALLSDGTVQCWGANESGELGSGSRENSDVPVTVVGLAGVVAISAGASYYSGGRYDGSSGSTCALLRNGTVWCWGCRTGDGTEDCSTVPVQVAAW